MKLTERYRRLSPSVRTSVWFTICNFLQRGTACIVVPIFTRLLTQEQYGVCNLYFALFDIFILFTSLKLPYEGLNNGLIRWEEDKDGYTSAILGLILVMTCGMAGVYLLLRPYIDAFTGLSGFLMAVMFFQLLINPPLMLWTNRERFDSRYRLPVLVTLISTIANPVIAVLAVLHTDRAAEARIIATAAVQGFFGILCACFLFARGKTFYNRTYWSFALRFNLPLLSYYISQSLLNQSDRIMINYFAGGDKTAIYSVAYSAATLVLLFVSAVNGSFNPWMYKKLKAGQYRNREIASNASLLCLCMGAATLAMTAFAPDLVTILATADYREAIWIIPPVSASVYFVFVYMMFANVEMYYGETRGISVISIICGAANVLLNAIFIPLFGYMAAGWTTLVCYGLLAALHFVLMKRACTRHGIAHPIFDETWILVLSTGVVLLCFVMMGLYKVPYLRYAVILAELVLLFLFRGKLLSAIRAMRPSSEEPPQTDTPA